MRPLARSILRFALPLLCLGLGLCLVSGLARASIVRLLNIEDLAGRADRIFAGRCVDVRESYDPALGQHVTYTTFEVSRAVKGGVRGRITIRSLGGADADPSRPDPIASVPRFRVGEDVVLFLYPDSRNGLTSPVGFGQGKFRIVKDKLGREIALNATGNRTLFRGLSGGAVNRLDRSRHAWKGRSDVPPDALLDLAAGVQLPERGGASR